MSLFFFLQCRIGKEGDRRRRGGEEREGNRKDDAQTRKKKGCDATVTGWVALGRTASEGNIFVFFEESLMH